MATPYEGQPEPPHFMGNPHVPRPYTSPSSDSEAVGKRYKVDGTIKPPENDVQIARTAIQNNLTKKDDGLGHNQQISEPLSGDVITKPEAPNYSGRVQIKVKANRQPNSQAEKSNDASAGGRHRSVETAEQPVDSSLEEENEPPASFWQEATIGDVKSAAVQRLKAAAASRSNRRSKPSAALTQGDPMTTQQVSQANRLTKPGIDPNASTELAVSGGVPDVEMKSMHIGMWSGDLPDAVGLIDHLPLTPEVARRAGDNYDMVVDPLTRSSAVGGLLRQTILWHASSAFTVEAQHIKTSTRGFGEKLWGKDRQNMVNHNRNVRVLDLAKSVGPRALAEVVDTTQTPEEKIRTAWGQLGVETHYSLIDGRYLVDGDLAAQRIEEESGTVKRNPDPAKESPDIVIGRCDTLYLAPDSNPDSKDVRTYDTTILVMDSKNQAYLATMRPWSVPGPGIINSASGKSDARVLNEVTAEKLQPGVVMQVVNSMHNQSPQVIFDNRTEENIKIEACDKYEVDLIELHDKLKRPDVTGLRSSGVVRYALASALDNQTFTDDVT